MIIYNYLFYKSYQLALRSKNFDDTPVLGGIIFVAICVVFNIYTIYFVLQVLGIGTVSFNMKYKYPFGLVLVIVTLMYYLFDSRYKKIIEKFEQKERAIGKSIHPIFVIIAYCGVSVGLMFLAALFKNGDWVFRTS